MIAASDLQARHGIGGAVLGFQRKQFGLGYPHVCKPPIEVRPEELGLVA